jgi:hypothetical protein
VRLKEKRRASARRLGVVGEAEGKIQKEKARVFFHFSHFSDFVCFFTILNFDSLSFESFVFNLS